MASDPPARSGLAPRALRLLRRALLRLHLGALRFPKTTLVVTLAVCALAATQVPNIRVLIDLRDLGESRLPSTENARKLEAEFGLGESVLILFEPAVPGASFSAASLERISDWVEEERRSNGDLVRVLSPFRLRRLVPALFPAGLVRVIPQKTAEGLRALGATPWAGILTDNAQRDVAVEMVFRSPPPPSRYGGADPTALRALWARCERQVLALDPTVVAHFGGTAAFHLHSIDGIGRFRILNLVILVLILAAHRLFFGTWRSGVLVAGVLLVAGIVVYGAMSATGTPIDYLSTGLFLILAVAALEDWMFLCHQQLARGTPWRRALRGMLVPCFFTSLTTVIGFGSLLVSDLAIVRRFGVWAGFGASLEWVVTFLVLPSLLAVWPRLRVWTDPARAWRGEILDRLAQRPFPRAVAYAALLVFVLVVPAALRLSFSDDPATIFDRMHPYRRTIEYLARSRGWVAELSVVFHDASRRDPNRKILESLRQLPNVGRVTDPYAVVEFLTGKPVDPSSKLLRGGAPAGTGLDSLFSAEGEARASLYLRDVSLAPLRETIRQVEAVCRSADCHAAGDLAFYAEFGSEVPSTLFESFLLCFLLVGLVVVFLARALGRGFPAALLMSAFWGPALMLLVLAVARIPINFLTCVFASVLVGLTGDNGIQYLFASSRRVLASGIDRRGGGSIRVGLLMAAASLTFLGSSFVPSRRLGVLLAFGFVACLVGDLWLLRSLLRKER